MKKTLMGSAVVFMMSIGALVAPAAAYAVEEQEVPVVVPSEAEAPVVVPDEEGLQQLDSEEESVPVSEDELPVPPTVVPNEDDSQLTDPVLNEDGQSRGASGGEEEESSEEEGELPEAPQPTRVVVEAPTKVVEPCSPPAAPEYRYVKIAPTEGVQFFVNGVAVDPSSGLVPVFEYEATVTAVAQDGYLIEGQAEWFIPFDFKECPSDIVLPEFPIIVDGSKCPYGCEPPYDMVLPDFTVQEDAVIPAAAPATVTPKASTSSAATVRPAELAVTGSDATTINAAAFAGVLALVGAAAMLVRLREKRSTRPHGDEH